MTIGQICKKYKFSESEFETFLKNEGSIKLTGLFHNKISDLDTPRAVELFKKHLEKEEDARLLELAKTVLPSIKKETETYYEGRKIYGSFETTKSSLTLYEDHIVIHEKDNSNTPNRFRRLNKDREENDIVIPLSSIKYSKDTFYRTKDMTNIYFTEQHPDVSFCVNGELYLFDYICFPCIKDLNAHVLRIYKYIIVHSGMSDVAKMRTLNNILHDDTVIPHYGTGTGNRQKDASVVGRAIAGGIIAGPAGAVVGAVSAADKNAKNRNK